MKNFWWNKLNEGTRVIILFTLLVNTHYLMGYIYVTLVYETIYYFIKMNYFVIWIAFSIANPYIIMKFTDINEWKNK